MERMISYKNRRCLKIAEELITVRQFLTYNEIEVLNSCSRKTVYDDLNYLQERWNHILDLTIDNNLVSSNTSSVFDLMTLKRKLLNKEIKIQFIINLYKYPYKGMPFHSQSLNYSESHLRRQIKPINNYLKDFKSTIKYFDNDNKDGYYIETDDEICLCFLVSQLIKVSDHRNLLLPLDTLTQKQANDFIRSISSFIPESLEIDLQLFYETSLLRKKNGDFKQDYYVRFNETFKNTS